MERWGIGLLDLLAYSAHQIEREDSLISTRLNWLLTFQGFLFLSVAALLSRGDDLSGWVRGPFVLAAAAAGIAVSCAGSRSISAATASLTRIIRGWERVTKLCEVDLTVVVNPYGNLPGGDQGHDLARRIPCLIGVAWVAVALAVVGDLLF